MFQLAACMVCLVWVDRFMSVEGRLQIQLFCRHGSVREATLHSTRPFNLTQLFQGKTVDQLLQTLPLLYGVCKTAQTVAAVMAARGAAGCEVSPQQCDGQQRLVWFETAREHLWRILFEWPTLLGELASQSATPPLSSLVNEAAASLFPKGDWNSWRAAEVVDLSALEGHIARLEQMLQFAVFGCPVDEFFQLDSVDALQQWAQSDATVSARLIRQVAEEETGLSPGEVVVLPQLSLAQLNRCLSVADAKSFIARPQWEGRSCETTSLGRQLAHPLVTALLEQEGAGLYTRMVARLMELASIAVQLRGGTNADIDSESTVDGDLPAGVGIAQLEAARGRLIHRVELAGQTVQRYQILAPTEWNFHPRGVALSGLIGAPVESEPEIRRLASAWISAIDPCVGYDLVLHHA